ncbi:hypothetical protein HH310_41895 [Actinoplanes sp. TBRC 11911]|uniref:hypothetical protein n=1 Tax=Actinoplanes sp. TBRC 11911 TaxID=2729386 RepID=UPI00145C5128|nr:hypothetical protein [Actinoplanes sp. TBRC 11911]NMO57703.1 hypothetical protein [Actinoplanes sp. TBRC 11911]
MLKRILQAGTALFVLLGTGLPLVTPAEAASYRDLKSAEYGTCVYAYNDPLEDLYLKSCATTPTQYGNWTVTTEGYYNDHTLWVLKRQSGTCLGVSGSASNSYLYSSCTTTGSRNVWEIFPTSGRYVLKSFGAFQSWGKHACLTFSGATGRGRPQLGTCSLTTAVNQIYR